MKIEINSYELETLIDCLKIKILSESDYLETIPMNEELHYLRTENYIKKLVDLKWNLKEQLTFVEGDN